jgi:hypothetical protein
MGRRGDDWLWEDGEASALELYDRETGARVRPIVIDENPRKPIDVRGMTVGARN